MNSLPSNVMTYEKICNKLEELEMIVSNLIDSGKNIKPLKKDRKDFKNGK